MNATLRQHMSQQMCQNHIQISNFFFHFKQPAEHIPEHQMYIVRHPVFFRKTAFFSLLPTDINLPADSNEI